MLIRQLLQSHGVTAVLPALSIASSSWLASVQQERQFASQGSASASSPGALAHAAQAKQPHRTIGDQGVSEGPIGLYAPEGAYSHLQKSVYDPVPGSPQDLMQRSRPERPREHPDDIPEVMGKIHSTESFSAVDGPGVRFLVFLQGCAMRCLFCANPDTWEMQGGQQISSKQVIAKVRKVLPYLQGGGGITCSGGEPMLQPQFVQALFREAHALGLNTCIDTTGQGTKHHNWDVVLPHTDLVLWCIKHIDPEKYRALCGLNQKGAMSFAQQMAERQVPFWLRYVFVPGYTDAPEDVQRLIEFCKKQPTLRGIELLPYHQLGRNKWEVLKLKYPLEGVEPPTRKSVSAAIDTFRQAGINVICNN